MHTELVLIRHGETVWNAQDRFQGQQDSPLTPEGLAQAEIIGAHLAGYGLDALYSSDLGRTVATAARIAAATGRPVVQERDLRERNLGVLEGLTRAEAERDYAEVFARYMTRDPDFVLPEGESLRQLETRAAAILETLALRHAGGRVAVVSHGGTLTTFVRHVLGVPLTVRSRFALRNGSLSWLTHADAASGWTLLSLGEVTHLRVGSAPRQDGALATV
jgi:probable phosphoglycerate mutase